MTITEELHQRSGATCELCAATNDLNVYEVPKAPSEGSDYNVLVCSTCLSQIKEETAVDANHWRCLNDSMWSTVPAVQVVAWQMLNRLRGEGWPADLLDMMYLEGETLAWAEASIIETPQHIDAHGNVLSSGDTVILTQNLKVKGTSFTAKKGTTVRRISLVLNNVEHIEGKINDQQIVILTKFVKKAK